MASELLRVVQQQLSTPLHLVTFILASVVFAAYLLYRSALPKPIPGIPFDAAAAKRLLGSIPDMMAYQKDNGVMIAWMAGQVAKFNSPLVQLFMGPFTKPYLVLCDYQESQDILLRRTKEFDRAQRSLDGFVGILPHHHISMKSTDPRFKGNKELVRDLMSPSFLHEGSAVQIYDKSLALIELWTLKAKLGGGKPFPARRDIFDAAVDMVGAAAFAFDDDMSIVKRQLEDFRNNGAGMQEKPDGSVEFSRLPWGPGIDSLMAVTRFLGSQVNAPFPVLAYRYAMLTDAKLRRDMAQKDEVIKAQIKKSVDKFQSGDETQISAVDHIIQREYSVARKEERPVDMFSRRTIDELFGYIVGGHETTSSALSWSIKILADHQVVQDKLRRTLQATFSDAVSESRNPGAKAIAKANIPYLDAVIEECLRVGLPTPMVSREATMDTNILGHKVPKGTTILISSSGPGFLSLPLEIPNSVRSETSQTKHWGGTWDKDDMHLFKPERWLRTGDDGEVVFDPQAGPFLVFSLGPRGCFGKRLAYLEMRLVLTLLLWNFRFRKLDDNLSKYNATEAVTVMPVTCYVGLEKI